jgi:hypothetical protein
VDVSLRLCRVASCRVALIGRRSAYCSQTHARAFEADHLWPAARRRARRKARWACQRCGFKPSAVRKDPELARGYRRHELKLEVDHIDALRGRYRFVSCLNHADNLEVLCHRCHVEVTNARRSSGGDASTLETDDVTTYDPPPDIAARIEQDFDPGALDGICRLLQPLVDEGLGDRVVRCILILSSGEIGRLQHNVEQALLDYRDVIYWAEYDANRRVFDFNFPFEEAALP